ncbi:hypothetical protein KSS87_017206 [Heliosperma pusillum]|nr:hypothetical protein KSS87_017206 [Heliosperma pusillum]
MVCTLSGIALPSSVPCIHQLSGSNFYGSIRSSSLPFFLNSNGNNTRKIFVQKSSYDPDSPLTTLIDSQKVLVPGGEDEGPSFDDVVESNPVISDLEGEHDLDVQLLKANVGIEEKQDFETGSFIPEDAAVKNCVSKREIPPTGDGQRIYEIDSRLKNHRTHLDYRYSMYRRLREEINRFEGSLESFSRGYEKMGFTRRSPAACLISWLLKIMNEFMFDKCP